MSTLCVALIEWCLFFNLLQRELWIHSRIEVHLWKTQVWNRGGFEPPGCHLLIEVARRLDPTAIVWKGDHTLPVDEQGVKVLGTPLGQQRVRGSTIESHHRRTPSASEPDSTRRGSAVRMLLLFCAASRPNYVLRVVHPDATDEDARRCLEVGLVLPDAAFFASWADGLEMIQKKPVCCSPHSERFDARSPIISSLCFGPGLRQICGCWFPHSQLDSVGRGRDPVEVT